MRNRHVPLFSLLLLCLAPLAGGCAAEKAALAFDPDAGFVDPAEPARSLMRVETGTGSMAGGGSTWTPARADESPVASPPAPPELPADVQQANSTGAASQPGSRIVIYSAAYRLVVADVPGTLRSIRESAERLGGYLQEISSNAITVRVPAARFNDAVAAVEQSGEVVDRQVKAQDVTEEMRDLRIRLDNAEKLRERLLKLLDKAEKVEDAVKIEAELARVSEQIDATKGKIRALESQVAMSTLRVELNSPVPQNLRGTGPRLPFEWVNDLGDGLVAGQVQPTVRRAGFFARGPKFQTPEGFVRYYEDKDWAEAMDATGLLLRVHRHPNVDKAPLAFWSALVRRQLVEGRSLAVADDWGDDSLYLLRGGREVGGKPVGYLLAVKRNPRAVVVFEAWGPREQFEASLDALRDAAVSIDPG